MQRYSKQNLPAAVMSLFNRAVGQLTDAKLEVRLGAIYTLREIAGLP
jgi:hypothetical protein